MEQTQKKTDTGNQLYKMSIVKGFFPFIYPDKQGILEKIAFFFLIWLLAIPLFMTIGIFITPKFPDLLYVLDPLGQISQFNIVTALMDIFVLWVLLGAVIYTLATHPFRGKTLKDFGVFIKNHLWQTLFVIFFLWTFISSLGAPNIKLAFKGVAYRNEGFESICGYAAIFVCVRMISNEKKKRALLYCFSAMSIFLCIVMLGQHFEWAFIIKHHFSNKMSGVFPNTNHTGYLLCISVLVVGGFFTKEKKWWKCLIWGALFAFEFWVLVQNNTFGSYLATVIACVFGVWLYTVGLKVSIFKSLIPLALCVLISLTVGIAPQSAYGTKNVQNNFKSLTTDIDSISNAFKHTPTPSISPTTSPSFSPAPPSSVNDQLALDHVGSSRGGLWLKTIDFIMQRPIFGWGPEQLGDLFVANKMAHNCDRPHNEYLQFGASFGIVGILMYVAGLVILFIEQVKRLKRLDATAIIAAVSVIGYLISAVFGVTMNYTYACFLLLLAIASAPPTPIPTTVLSD